VAPVANMDTHVRGYTIQLASDVVRDGLGVEMLDASGRVVAEVFRCDAVEEVTLEIFEASLAPGVVDELVAHARTRLGTFESGAPLGIIVLRTTAPRGA
jgi:hypothetical protein